MAFPAHMHTGRIVPPSSSVLPPEFEERVQCILVTLIEKSFIKAAEYCEAGNRNIVTGIDIIYALQWCAHEFFNDDKLEESFDRHLEQIRSTHSCSESEDESDVESECDSDDEFERVEDLNNELVTKMNQYHDEWDTWIPESELQQSLKDAINRVIDQNQLI
jgi:hypothetical protein